MNFEKGVSGVFCFTFNLFAVKICFAKKTYERKKYMMKRIIALLLVLSTTLLFGCNIEFVDPNASADGSFGGSAIVTPDGGTTTKPNGGTTGGTTSGTTSGGSTTTPDSGTTSGGNTSGGSTSKPDSGTTGGSSTTKPDSGTTGGSTTTPDSGTTGGNTSGGSSTTTPDSGTIGSGSTTTPDSGTTGSGSTTTPDGGASGGSTTVVPDDKPVTPPEPTSSTDINFVYPKLKAAFDAFSARSSYQTAMSGKTLAFVYEQKISSTVNYANGIWKSYYESTSTLVKLYHHVYVSGDNVVYSHANNKNNGTLANQSLSWYRQNFGVAPCDYQLGGYVVDLTTITSASYNKDANGKVTFVISVDGNKSKDMLVQMVKFGGLDNTPTFTELKFTIICENGRDISSYDTYAKYNLKRGMSMKATMTLTTTVSDYDGTLTFPKV